MLPWGMELAKLAGKELGKRGWEALRKEGAGLQSWHRASNRMELVQSLWGVNE